MAANSEEVFARQIRYIQVQLNSNAPDDCGQPSDDEEEFEDIDEEGEDDGEDVDELEAIEGSPVKVFARSLLALQFCLLVTCPCPVGSADVLHLGRGSCLVRSSCVSTTWQTQAWPTRRIGS